MESGNADEFDGIIVGGTKSMSELHVSEQSLDEKIESFQKQFGIVSEDAVVDEDDYETTYELVLEDY